MSRGLWTAGLALLLATAGCTGFGADLAGDAGAPVTPAPIPDDGGAYPPGVAADGVVDPGRLGDAHGLVLADAGYLVEANRTARYPNGTRYSALRVRVALAANRTHSATVATRGPGAPVLLGRPPARATFWSDGDRFLRRLERDDRTVYNEYTPPDSHAGTWRYWVHDVALDGRPAADVTETVGAFRTRTAGQRGRWTVVHGAELREDSVGDERVADPEAASLVARVRQDGFVRSYRVTYRSRTPEGRALLVTRTVRYEAVGNTTVGRPPGDDRAVEDDGTPTP